MSREAHVHFAPIIPHEGAQESGRSSSLGGLQKCKACMTAAGDKFALLDEDEEQLTHLGRSLADDDFKAVRIFQSMSSIHYMQDTLAVAIVDT